MLLMGVSRVTFTEAEKQALSDLGIQTDQEPARVLLTAVALLRQGEKAGYSPKTWEGQLNLAPEVDPKTLFPPQLTIYLDRLLSTELLQPLLPEFLQLAKDKKLYLPVELLPAILEVLAKGEVPTEDLSPLLGPQGEWLVQQHPLWKQWFGNPGVDNWSISSRDTRLAILKHLRRKGDPRFEEWILEDWSSETVQGQLQWLNIIARNPSPEDATLLRSLPESTAPEINDQILGLLLQIPGTPERVEVQTKLLPLFRWAKEGITFDKLKWEQLLPKLPRPVSAPWFLMNFIPPQAWSVHFSRSTAEILERWSGAKDWGAILPSLLQAAAFHPEPEWQYGLLQYLLDQNDIRILDTQPGTAFRSSLSKDSWNRLLTGFFARGDILPDHDQLLFHLLCRMAKPLPPEFGPKIFQQLVQESGLRFSWANPHHPELLMAIARNAAPTDLMKLRELATPYLQEARETVMGKLLKIINFRLGALRFTG